MARDAIRSLFVEFEPNRVVSGECHLGGIDVWAREEAVNFGIEFQAFPPKHRSWSAGYKPRNMLIAQASDLVACITVRDLPEDYEGMRFAYCYHCGTKEHVKSGGCWTVKYAKTLGKDGRIIVI